MEATPIAIASVSEPPAFGAAPANPDPVAEPIIRRHVRHKERRFHVGDVRSLLAILHERGAPLEYVPGHTATDITTVYVDTADGTWSRGLSRNKFRCKNYDDPTAWWFEIKRREGVKVDKRRQTIAPAELPEVLVGTRRGPLLARLIRQTPLLPLVAVRYRRIAFEWTGLRVTVDRSLQFHAVGSGTPWTLGRCIGRKRGFVVEVKCAGPVPDWLAAPLGGGRSQRFSKSRWALAARSLA